MSPEHLFPQFRSTFLAFREIDRSVFAKRKIKNFVFGDSKKREITRSYSGTLIAEQ